MGSEKVDNSKMGYQEQEIKNSEAKHLRSNEDHEVQLKRKKHPNVLRWQNKYYNNNNWLLQFCWGLWMGHTQ